LGTKLGGWPQDVANLRNKLKSLSFSRVSEVALGPLFRVPLLRFGHEIGWCFAVAHVPQSHAFFVIGGLVGHKMWQTCVTSSKVSVLVGFQKWR